MIDGQPARISRDPTDPDFDWQFDNFVVLQNGSETMVSSVAYADEVNGVIGFFEWDTDETVALDDAGQPIVNEWKCRVEVKYSSQDPHRDCSPCTKKAIQRRQWWPGQLG